MNILATIAAYIKANTSWIVRTGGSGRRLVIGCKDEQQATRWLATIYQTTSGIKMYTSRLPYTETPIILSDPDSLHKIIQTITNQADA